MERETFMHSQILRCGFSWSLEVCKMGTSYQPSRFLRQLLHLPAGPRLGQEGAGPLFSHSQNHILGGWQLSRQLELLPAVSGSFLGTLLWGWLSGSLSGTHFVSTGGVGFFWLWCQRGPYLQGAAWVAATLASWNAFSAGEKGSSWVSAGLTASTEVPLCLRWFLCLGQRPHSHFMDVHPVRCGPDGQLHVQDFMNLALQGDGMVYWLQMWPLESDFLHLNPGFATCSVPLGKLLDFSIPQFPHL